MDLYLHLGMTAKIFRCKGRVPFRERFMELLLQFGYGMMDHSKSLIKEWGSGSVILSPRDLTSDQLAKLAKDVKQLGGNVLLDPQFYLPSADHDRLRSHAFWPVEYESVGFWSGTELQRLLGSLISLNEELGSKVFIIPGIYAATVDDDWVARQNSTLEELERFDLKGKPRFLTVALSGDAARSDDQIHRVLEAANEWGVEGIYLVVEHPNGDYLVTDPSWLSNELDLVAGFRLKGLQVLVGYSNHQQLITACAGANAIASGTWMNVRSFPPDKFRTKYEDEIKQRTTWYYSPVALSEYKIPFLDIAKKQGLLSELAAPREYQCSYAEALFSGPQPTAVSFGEQAAFRHYLSCLKQQVMGSKKGSFDETVRHHEDLLDQAENLLSRLRGAGIKGQLRDFSECIDANRAALSVLNNTRGPMLRRNWQNL